MKGERHCYCTVRLPVPESRDVEEGRGRRGQAETHNMMTHTGRNVNRGRKRCISVTIFSKTNPTPSHFHVNATFKHVICSHCEISRLPLGMVDDITHHIQFALKIYTVQAHCVIHLWWIQSSHPKSDTGLILAPELVSCAWHRRVLSPALHNVVACPDLLFIQPAQRECITGSVSKLNNHQFREMKRMWNCLEHAFIKHATGLQGETPLVGKRSLFVWKSIWK